MHIGPALYGWDEWMAGADNIQLLRNLILLQGTSWDHPRTPHVEELVQWLRGRMQPKIPMMSPFYPRTDAHWFTASGVLLRPDMLRTGGKAWLSRPAPACHF